MQLLVEGGTGTTPYSLGVMGHYAQAQVKWWHLISGHETFKSSVACQMLPVDHLHWFSLEEERVMQQSSVSISLSF